MTDPSDDKLEQIIQQARQQINQTTTPSAPTPTPDEPDQPEITPEQPTLPAEQVINFEQKALQDWYDGVFKVLAYRYGDHWKLNPTEAEMLAKPSKAVLDKYMIKTTPEGMLVLSVAMIVVPRIVTTVSENKKKQPEVEGDNKNV